MSLGRCTLCGDLIVGGHRCPPAWRVWREDETQEDGRDVFAYSEAHAAELWADHDDRHSADYTIVGGSPARVWVRSLETADRCKDLLLDVGPTLFEVHGETVPSYTAHRATLRAEAG